MASRFFSILVGMLLMASLGAGISSAYAPRFDAEEQENISVYEKASLAVVTVSAVVGGKPSTGAGVVIDPSGMILTSSHVVGEALAVTVTLGTPEGESENTRGVVIGRMGANSDLALLKVATDRSLTHLPLGDSSQVRVGQKVLAIGNPYGFERTLTTGIISRIDVKRDRLQTDAAINPGNSGGPLLDTQGYVIGINQSIFNPDGNRSNIGIGFAVPVNAAKTFLRELAAQPARIPGQTVAVMNTPGGSAGQQPAIIRINPEYARPGYENVSVILKKFSQAF